MLREILENIIGYVNAFRLYSYKLTKVYVTN